MSRTVLEYSAVKARLTQAVAGRLDVQPDHVGNLLRTGMLRGVKRYVRFKDGAVRRVWLADGADVQRYRKAKTTRENALRPGAR